MAPVLRIGLTGGIASGKSTVAGLLSRHGAGVIDADAISRSLTAPGGSALDAIRAAFGAGVFDAQGNLDRGLLRARVFADADQRRLLEQITHPLISARCQEMARALQAIATVLVFDIPLLVEAPAVRLGLGLERILVIDCPLERQLAHARARGTMLEEQIRAAIASQASRSQRLEMADDVVVNAGTLEALAQRVARLWADYTACARGRTGL